MHIAQSRCYIFAAGDYKNTHIDTKTMEDGFIIAADGGYAYLKKNCIRPHLAVGDFDSLMFVPNDVEVIRHPCEKDDTDMMLAVQEGFKRGYDNFIIYGALGGRIDHTLANIQILQYIANKGGHGTLCNDDEILTAVCNDSITFSSEHHGTVSVFCLGEDAEGVTIKGLKYEVTNVRLNSHIPLGISNEFIGKEAEITVSKGCLVVIYGSNKR